MRKSIFITGPQGSGKTRLAEILYRLNPETVLFDGITATADLMRVLQQAEEIDSLCIITSQLPETIIPKETLPEFDIFKLQCM
jgi:energy-coupling factor transporter ATP-binding protein EcfA2